MSHVDILEEPNLTVVSHQIEMRGLLQPEDETEPLVLDQVTHESIHIDDIGRQIPLPIPVVSSTLSMMELKGLIKQVGGMYYVRVREAVAGYGS